MSLILDALRRADAERQRGQPPALQQVTLALPAAPGEAAGLQGPRWPLVAGLVMAAALLALGLGLWWGRGQPAVTPVPVPAAAPSPANPAALPSTPATPAAPTAAPPAMATPQATRPRAAPPVPSPVPAPAAATSPAAPVLGAERLPEAQRQALARLVFGGAVQSQDRSQSFVLVNGELLREGSTLAPGLVLEHIQSRALLLRVGESRFEWPL